MESFTARFRLWGGLDLPGTVRTFLGSLSRPEVTWLYHVPCIPLSRRVCRFVDGVAWRE